jgi:phosphoenolpyruvate carboxylase
MTKLVTELNAVEASAVARALDSKSKVAKTASEILAVGEHDVDVTIRVTGTLKRGEDEERPIANKIDWTLLSAVLLSHVNEATRNSVLREYKDASPELQKSLKAEAVEGTKDLVSTTMTKCNGRITTKLEIQKVS